MNSHKSIIMQTNIKLSRPVINVKNILTIVATLIIFLNPISHYIYKWCASMVLIYIFDIELLITLVTLLGNKINALFVLTAIIFLLFVFRKKTYNFCQPILKTKGLYIGFIYFLFLSIPSLVFYYIGLQVFLINYWSFIILGAFATLFIELFLLLFIFYLASLMPFYRITTAVILLLIYEFTVIVMTVLVKATGEINHIKYIPMAWGADYSYILHWDVISIIAILALIITLIAIRIAKKLYKYKNFGLKLGVMAVVLLLSVYFIKPVILFGEMIALPYKYFNTENIVIEAKNTNSLIGSHTPYLLSSIFRSKNNNHNILHEIPAELEATAKKLNFPQNSLSTKHDYAKFKRIILLTVESLSWKFTAFNKDPICDKTITPTIDRLMQTYSGGVLKNNSSPTLYGLSSIFSSHPNAKLIIDKEYPNSFVKILKDNGYRTVFMRSAIERYLNEHVLFKKAGFTEIYGRDFFSNNKQLSSHISGWGLEDAYLFDYTVDFLKQNQSEKIFVHILPVDTHTPYGREFYSNKYPDIFDNLSCKIDNRRLLKAFYKQDFDINRFYNKLIKNSLLDEETLFIITADHSSTLYPDIKSKILAEVPIVFISKNKIIDNLNLKQKNISQVDIAPTILELSGIKIPWGYYGKSLTNNTKRTYISIYGRNAKVITDDKLKIVPLNDPKTNEDANLIKFLNTVFVK